MRLLDPAFNQMRLMELKLLRKAVISTLRFMRGHLGDAGLFIVAECIPTSIIEKALARRGVIATLKPMVDVLHEGALADEYDKLTHLIPISQKEGRWRLQADLDSLLATYPEVVRWFEERKLTKLKKRGSEKHEDLKRGGRKS